MAGTDWSRDEVEATVSDYFSMLRAELAGESYSKAQHRRVLVPLLDGRSEQSVEFKHCNISAVLLAWGLPPIDGYKPRAHGQQLLEQVVLEYLATEPKFFEGVLDSEVLSPSQKPMSQTFAAIQEPPPEPIESAPRAWDPNARVVPVDFVRRDAENRRLGTLGEEFVLEIEQRRLHDEVGRQDLAKQVEWTSRERGDGAGYDIRSFEADGSPRYIEVKTTGLAKPFPFYVTANEVACSMALRDEYHLYRLFRFSRTPGLYVLTGALSETCHLDPTQFRARFAR
ncbi:MAG: DUF3883 domain-containing protein [Vicinamibacterales bacterium]